MAVIERLTDFSPQDWILIAEALAQWAGPPTELATAREERGYELIEAIAAEQGLPPDELAPAEDLTIFTFGPSTLC